MRGSVKVRVLFYQTNRRGIVNHKYYEEGFSKVQPLNNTNQEERAFNSAMSNAIRKYSYHIGEKYDDVEFNYNLLESHIIYTSHTKDKETKKYTRTRAKTNLTRNDKIRIHKNIIKQSTFRRENKDKDLFQSKESFDNMFASREDAQSTLNSMNKKDKVRIKVHNRKDEKNKKINL